MRMKAVSSVVVGILVIGMLMVPSIGAFEKGENRLLDSDFEVGNVDELAEQWTLEDATCCDRGGEYQWEIDDSVAHTGGKSLKIIGVQATGTGWHGKVRHESTSMENGGTFTIAFWAKVDASEANSRDVGTSVQMQHDPWTSYQGSDIVLDSTDWKEYFDTFVATADVVEDMWVGLSIAQSDVDFWIDDFRFFEGEPADEITAVEAAVTPTSKLPVSWGSIKDRY
jgi:hypothetical protein